MRLKNKIYFALLGFLLLANQLFYSQNEFANGSHVEFRISLNLAFGTHFQRAGLNFNFFYVNKNFQANSELRAYFNFRNLGPRLKYPELVLSQGVLFGYGKTAYYQLNNPFLNSVSNQTGRLNAIAYSYNAYFNKIKTMQQTGIVAIQVRQITLIAENDILARPMLDRFRTGAFLLQFQRDDYFQGAFNCTMWTGKMGHKTELSHSPIRSGCYMDTTAGVYSNISHGLLSVQLKYNLVNTQNIQFNAGADAEEVRDVVQNLFIHDMIFLPEKWRAKNCHIPMIDKKGEQYLYKPGQTIRRPVLYLNAFTNASVFY